MTDETQTRERIRQRWAFLRAIYGHHLNVPAGRIQAASIGSVAESVGFQDPGDVERAVKYLKDSGLIEGTAQGYVGITKYGIDQVERALLEPEDRTDHFPPINVITISGNVQGSAIQVGTSHSTQLVSAGSPDWSRLIELIPALRDAVMKLPPDIRAVSEADLATVEAQASSPRPRPEVVRECLRSIRTVLESGGGAVVGLQLEQWLKAAGWFS